MRPKTNCWNSLVFAGCSEPYRNRSSGVVDPGGDIDVLNLRLLRFGTRPILGLPRGEQEHPHHEHEGKRERGQA